jgi:hypothetical protein
LIRIERRRPRSLLRELPDGWAQTCITGPPAEESWRIAGLTAVLRELHRVIRPDGTLLWNIERPQPLPLRSLVGRFLIYGWVVRQSPLASSNGHLLFAKAGSGSYCYWKPDVKPVWALRSREAGCGAPCRVWWQRRAACVIASPRDDSADRRSERMLERLLLAATARTACAACGTPFSYRPRGCGAPSASGAPGLAGCGHLDPRGRCLVIDPYRQPRSPLAAIAARHGRSYLGIQAPASETRERQ